MELTTSFQKIGTGTQKSYGQSAGYLELWAKYNSQDIQNNRTNVTVELRLVVPYGYIGNYASTYWSISGNLSNSGDLGSDSYRSRTLGSATGNITHNADGTKSVSFSGSFNPTAWGQTLDVSGSATLPNLHKPPVIKSIYLEEENDVMSTIGITGNQFVPYLSKKLFAITTETYDNATITKYEVINGSRTYQNTSNNISIDFRQNPLYVTYSSQLQRNIADLTIRITDSLGASSSITYTNTYIVPYFQPTIESTSTNIKRKTGNGTVLTDNKGVLNLVASYYNENDSLGNNNFLTIQYKIWESTEPEEYIDISSSATISGNTVTIEDYELSNLNYEKVYKYKIKISDNYGGIAEKEDTLSTGVSVWTEYKDRVDFKKITINGDEVYAKKVIYDGSLSGTDTTTLSNVKRFLDIYVRINFANRDGTFKYTIDTTKDNPVYGGAYMTPFDENNMGTMYVSEASYNNGTFTHTRIGYVSLSTGTFTARNSNQGYVIYRIETYD